MKQPICIPLPEVNLAQFIRKNVTIRQAVKKQCHYQPTKAQLCRLYDTLQITAAKRSFQGNL